MEDIEIPLRIEQDTAKGALALVQYSNAQKQVFQKVIGQLHATATWLAKLVERQFPVREVEGSSPRPNQHSGS